MLRLLFLFSLSIPRSLLRGASLNAFLSEAGLAREILGQARAGLFTICVSEEILKETERVLLEYLRIRKRYRYFDEAVAEYILLLRVVTQVIAGIPKIESVVRDPNDDKAIAYALKASAEYVVNRDKDLLDLKEHEQATIMSPERFIELIKGNLVVPPNLAIIYLEFELRLSYLLFIW